MIKNSKKLKARVEESITNLSNMGVIPADEVQLNLDVVYNSIIDEVCSFVPVDSPNAIVSYLKLIYDSQAKSLVSTGNVEADAYKLTLMGGTGAVPYDIDGGYPTSNVECTVLTNSDGVFVASFKNIIPGTININNNNTNYVDDGNGNIVSKSDSNVSLGTVDYEKAVFTLNTEVSDANLTYRFDIFNLVTSRNFVKYVKQFAQVYCDLYKLDVDAAISLYQFKGLNLKDNIEKITPQVLTQQIDQSVLSRYFDVADTNVLGSWDSTIDWSKDRTKSVATFYNDLGTYIDFCSINYVNKTGVVPNILICDPKGYSILSSNRKFVSAVFKDEFDYKTAGTPKVVGYYNNFKVILVNTTGSESNIVMTYKGDSDSQSAGVFCSYIPVKLRSNISGMEGNSTIVTTNAFSMAGLVVTNPDLIAGIKIL